MQQNFKCKRQSQYRAVSIYIWSDVSSRNWGRRKCCDGFGVVWLLICGWRFIEFIWFAVSTVKAKTYWSGRQPLSSFLCCPSGIANIRCISQFICLKMDWQRMTTCTNIHIDIYTQSHATIDNLFQICECVIWVCVYMCVCFKGYKT